MKTLLEIINTDNEPNIIKNNMKTYNQLLREGFNFIRLPHGKIKAEHEITKRTEIGSMLTIRKKLSV